MTITEPNMASIIVVEKATGKHIDFYLPFEFRHMDFDRDTGTLKLYLDAEQAVTLRNVLTESIDNRLGVPHDWSVLRELIELRADK